MSRCVADPKTKTTFGRPAIELRQRSSRRRSGQDLSHIYPPLQRRSEEDADVLPALDELFWGGLSQRITDRRPDLWCGRYVSFEILCSVLEIKALQVQTF